MVKNTVFGHFLRLMLKGLKFRLQPKVCDSSCDLMQKAMKLNNFAIEFIDSIFGMSKNEAINIMKNSDLKVNSRTL